MASSSGVVADKPQPRTPTMPKYRTRSDHPDVLGEDCILFWLSVCILQSCGASSGKKGEVRVRFASRSRPARRPAFQMWFGPGGRTLIARGRPSGGPGSVRAFGAIDLPVQGRHGGRPSNFGSRQSRHKWTQMNTNGLTPGPAICVHLCSFVVARACRSAPASRRWLR